MSVVASSEFHSVVQTIVLVTNKHQNLKDIPSPYIFMLTLRPPTNRYGILVHPSLYAIRLPCSRPNPSSSLKTVAATLYINIECTPSKEIMEIYFQVLLCIIPVFLSNFFLSGFMHIVIHHTHHHFSHRKEL